MALSKALFAELTQSPQHRKKEGRGSCAGSTLPHKDTEKCFWSDPHASLPPRFSSLSVYLRIQQILIEYPLGARHILGQACCPHGRLILTERDGNNQHQQTSNTACSVINATGKIKKGWECHKIRMNC